MKKVTCTFPLTQTETKRFAQKPIAVHWGEFLNTLPWDFYCTFTSRHSLTKIGARNAMGRLKNHLAIKYGSEPAIFWAAEPFDSKHGYHLHALLKDNRKSESGRISSIKEAWQIVNKGKYGKENKFTTVVPYDPNLGGHYYVAKYLHRHNADYDFA